MVLECTSRRDQVVGHPAQQQQHHQRGSMPVSSRRIDKHDRSVQTTLLGAKIRVTPKSRRASGGETHTSSGGKSLGVEKRQVSLVDFVARTRGSASSSAAPSRHSGDQAGLAEATLSSTRMSASPAPSMLWYSSGDENGVTSPRPKSKRKHAQHDDQPCEGSADKKRRVLTSSRRRPSTSDLTTSSVYDTPPGAATTSKSSPLTTTQENKRNTDETQVLSWDSDVEVGPQSFLAPLRRSTPDRKIIRGKRRNVAYAPAISPKKKKSLIEQSAKDFAIQQARRSKGPLQAIDNLTKPAPARGRDNTPSPLRAGFSMIQLDRSMAPDSSETEDEDYPPSPLSERGASPEKRRELQLPTDGQRIYVYETQRVNGRRTNLAGFDNFNSSQWPTNNHQESRSVSLIPSLDRNLQCTQSNGCHAGGELPALAHTSSQTAPGGSWPNGAQVSSQEHVNEASMEGRAGADNWRKSKGRSSSSSSLYEDISPCDMTSPKPSHSNEPSIMSAGHCKRRSTVRSGVQLAKGRHLSTTSTDDEMPALAELTSLHLMGDETQPLPWDTDEETGRTSASAVGPHESKRTPITSETQPSSLPRRCRAPPDWVNLNDVWSAHLYDNVPSGGANASPSHSKGQQSQLASFGFSRASKKNPREQRPMSDAEEVSSSDDDDDDDEHGNTTITCTDTFARSSQSALSIPSASGLDSQVRNFFDVL